MQASDIINALEQLGREARVIRVSSYQSLDESLHIDVELNDFLRAFEGREVRKSEYTYTLTLTLGTVSGGSLTVYYSAFIPREQVPAELVTL